MSLRPSSDECVVIDFDLDVRVSDDAAAVNEVLMDRSKSSPAHMDPPLITARSRLDGLSNWAGDDLH